MWILRRQPRSQDPPFPPGPPSAARPPAARPALPRPVLLASARSARRRALTPGPASAGARGRVAPPRPRLASHGAPPSGPTRRPIPPLRQWVQRRPG